MSTGWHFCCYGNGWVDYWHCWTHIPSSISFTLYVGIKYAKVKCCPNSYRGIIIMQLPFPCFESKLWIHHSISRDAPIFFRKWRILTLYSLVIQALTPPHNWGKDDLGPGNGKCSEAFEQVLNQTLGKKLPQNPPLYIHLNLTLFTP